MRKRFTVLLIAALLSTPSLLAQKHSGIFVSAKLGTTDIEVGLDESFGQVIDGDEDSKALEVGYQFHRFFAVQVGYHDFGRFDASGSCAVCQDLTLPLVADTKAYTATLVPQVDLIWRLTVFGKVGLVVWETELETTLDDSTTFLEDFTNEDLIVGAGARFRLLGPLSVFAEWERIASEIETISFGATLKY